MKLRTIIFVLALLSFLSTITGGYLYYTSLKKQTLEDSHKNAEAKTISVAAHIDKHIVELKEPTKKLSEYDDFQSVLIRPDIDNTRGANRKLKLIQDSMGASLAYLMDPDGNVLSSSNYAEPNSLVGNNYAFRPYFQQAIKGDTSIYLALGVTTGIRGIYYGQPVFNNDGDILGVVVFKMSLQFLDVEMDDPDRQGTMMFVSDSGVIFASGKKEWMFQVLWEITPEKREELFLSRQFGKGPWKWTGIAEYEDNNASNIKGDQFIIHRHDISSLPGWRVIYLHDLQTVSERITTPFFKIAGKAIIALSVFIGLAVLILYRKAIDDINMRKKAEKEKEELIQELQQALDEIKKLQGIIPICTLCKNIRDEKGAWNQLESYISNHSDALFSHGVCPKCLLEKYGITEDKIKK